MSSVPIKLEANTVRSSSLHWSRYAIFAMLAVGGAATDLLSKQWVFNWRGLPGEQPPWWIVDGYVAIETALNSGALFGMGSGFGIVFAIFAIFAALGIIVWMFIFGAAESRWLTVAMGCIMAGILGNLYDRLGLWSQPYLPDEWQRSVRDWILLCYGEYKWPNFNIADSLLVCGAIMLAWHSFTSKPTEESDRRILNSDSDTKVL